MGIIQFGLLKYNTQNFLIVKKNILQKKAKLHSFLNISILGFKNNFFYENINYFLQETKRLFLILHQILLKQGFILFLNDKNKVEKVIKFFCHRSFNFIFLKKNNFTNTFFKKPLFAFLIDNFCFKEYYQKMIPFFIFKNENNFFKKTFYFSFFSIKTTKDIYVFYKNISNFILVSKVFRYSKKNLR